MTKGKRGMPGLEPAMKQFVHDCLRGRKPRRLHMSRHKALSIKKFKEKEQKIEMKPTGLWYGLGDSWIDWCMNEVSGWLSPYIYELVLDEDKVLKVSNIAEFEKLEQEYLGVPEHFKLLQDMTTLGDPRMMSFFNQIDYPKIAETYGAIEIAPYIWKKRLESIWYYPWDCASGCIWNRSAIKELRLFAAYDKERKAFVRKSLQPDKPKV